MNLNEVQETYISLIGSEKIKLAQLKKRIFQIGTCRLIVVLACLLLCFALWGDTLAVAAIVFVSIVFFCILMKIHNQFFIRKKYCELLIQNAENELKGIDYDYSPFDGAPEYINGNHSFSLDLDLFGNKSFFQSINRTVTSYGKEKLADTLLSPYDKINDIEKQQEAVKELSAKTDLITHFRAMGKMNEAHDIDVEELSQGLSRSKQIAKTFWRFMPYISSASFVIVAALLISGIPPALPVSFIGLWWTVMFVISLMPVKDIKQKVNVFEKNMAMLQTYSDLFAIIESADFECESLKQLQSEVKTKQPASVAIWQLKAYCDNLDQSYTVLGLLFLNPVLFWNVIYASKIERWIDEYQVQVGQWFSVVGKFDSLVSLSLYAYNHPGYIYPKVSDKCVFEAKDLGHPMLNRDICVRNDVTINRNPFFLVVTGANMAGKSTYLRTVGINLVLACSGSVVCASALTFYPYHLVTNLRTSDSLADSESYFFAELKRLKMIIDRLQAGEQLFIILDEILKGTNSEDKQKGSIALMKQLIANNGTGIIATHDLILGNLEKEYPGEVKDYRFEADITDDQLTFTYKIRDGVAQNMNACFLMKKMGITGL